MFGYNSPYFDWLRQQDRMSTNDPNALTPSFAPQSTAIEPAYMPSMGSSGSPAGDDGGIMGGGGSLFGGGGISDKQLSGARSAMKGFGDAVNAFSGADAKPIQAPRIDDNSGAIRQQASQLWQQMMQKKPRGLI